MITCSSYRGQSYNPISQFDCLSADIPYLPVNKEGMIVEDIEVRIVTPELRIKSNNFLHKIKLGEIPKETNFVQIKSLFIFGANKNNENKMSISPSIDTAPPNAPFEHYGGLNPLRGKIALQGKDFFLVDVDIKNMLEIDIKDMQQYDKEVIKINKIILDMYFYKNEEELEKKHITLNISNEGDFIQKSIKEKNISNKEIYNMNNISNGSVAFCMDTGEVYKFDEEYDRWLKL